MYVVQSWLDQLDTFDGSGRAEPGRGDGPGAVPVSRRKKGTETTAREGDGEGDIGLAGRHPSEHRLTLLIRLLPSRCCLAGHWSNYPLSPLSPIGGSGRAWCYSIAVNRRRSGHDVKCW